MKKISVITISYNNKIDIENTIKSVISQTWQNIEYIVIDGGSNDGTIDIIENYIHNVDVFISEKDDGIYDALNKGITLATGDYLICMNAGDCFFSPTTIENVFEKLSTSPDIIYGNHIDPALPNQIIKPRKLSEFWKGMPFNHQSTFVKTTLQKKYPFNLKYRVSSVYDFFYKTWKNGYSFQYIDQTIAFYDMNGISATSYAWLWDYLRINYVHNPRDLVKVVSKCYIDFFSRLKRKIRCQIIL